MKPTLVLDLDENLVRTEFDEEEPAFPRRSVKVGHIDIWLALRPFVHQFLSSLSAHYELVVWTAGTEPYGRAVVNEFYPHGFTHLTQLVPSVLYLGR
jgi:TFIIF-interacting CTD phosphatase-like protein